MEFRFSALPYKGSGSGKIPHTGKRGRLSLPDSTLRGRIADILNREGATKNAARQIQNLLERDRFVDLKVAPEKLGISPRTMFRRIRTGSIKTVMLSGRRMVDLMAVNGSTKKMTAT